MSMTLNKWICTNEDLFSILNCNNLICLELLILMKLISLQIVVLIFPILCSAQVYRDTIEQSNGILEVSENIICQFESYDRPEFPGGTQKLIYFISKNLEYPFPDQVAHKEGKVFVKFLVNTRGNISNPIVIKGLGNGYDEEALRILKKMPKWKAGKENGKKIPIKMILPISFKLN